MHEWNAGRVEGAARGLHPPADLHPVRGPHLEVCNASAARRHARQYVEALGEAEDAERPEAHGRDQHP